MAGKVPRSPIICVAQTHNGHRPIYLEQLACGHTARGRRSASDIERDIRAGKQRQCFRCTHQR